MSMYTARKRHVVHRGAEYMILALILLTGLVSFMRFTGNIPTQLLVAGLTSVAYVAWGIFHHIYESDINWKIVVEYTTFGLTGFTLLWVLLVIVG